MHNTGRAVLAAATAAAIGLLAGACEPNGTSAAGSGASSASAAIGTSVGPTSAQTSGSTGSAVAPTNSVTASPANYPVDLQPQTAAAGSRVMVYGLTCSAETGTATSDAFTAPVALSMISNATGGSATVKPGLAAGRYTVTVTCGSITATGTLTVS